MVASRLLELRTSGRGCAVLAASLAFAFAGCGGSEVEYQEVPGDPAEITLPDRTPAAADDEEGAAEEGTDAEAAPTATATPADATGATTDGTTTDAPATTQATPAPAEDGETTDEPPVPGSDAERFEDFCEQNAGAC